MSIAFAILFCLFAWWFSTGAVLYLNGRSPGVRWRAFSLVTGLMVLALLGIHRSAGDGTPFGAYAGFTLGLIVWAWIEMSYFMGYVTGPRPEACPSGASKRERFCFGVKASLYHELLVLAAVATAALLVWGQGNRVAAWTLAVLWLMRWSTKLNLFLGLPRLNEAFFPLHMRYLLTYVARKPMNRLFPFSVLASAVALAAAGAAALDAGSAGEAVGWTLVATLIGLGLLEHWFLVLPVADGALWHWALTREAKASSAAP